MAAHFTPSTFTNCPARSVAPPPCSPSSSGNCRSADTPADGRAANPSRGYGARFIIRDARCGRRPRSWVEAFFGGVRGWHRPSFGVVDGGQVEQERGWRFWARSRSPESAVTLPESLVTINGIRTKWVKVAARDLALSGTEAAFQNINGCCRSWVARRAFGTRRRAVGGSRL